MPDGSCRANPEKQLSDGLVGIEHQPVGGWEIIRNKLSESLGILTQRCGAETRPAFCLNYYRQAVIGRLRTERCYTEQHHLLLHCTLQSSAAEQELIFFSLLLFLPHCFPLNLSCFLSDNRPFHPTNFHEKMRACFDVLRGVSDSSKHPSSDRDS